MNLKSTESKESKNITHSPNVEGTDINVNNNDIPNECHPSPKDIDEQLQHAGFWLRASVFFFDVFLFIVPLAIWITIAKDENPSTDLSKTQGLLWFWLLFFLYDTISNYKYGGTFAKRWFGLKVRGFNKLENLSYKQCAYRFISSTLFVHLGYLSQPFSKNRQALHDMVAGTVVVYIDPEKANAWGAWYYVSAVKITVLWFFINGGIAMAIFPDIFEPAEKITTQTVTQESIKDYKSGAMFRDCDDCPEMVLIPAGQFEMGVAPGEEERENLKKDYRNHSQPQHRVEVEQFAVGKFEVTVAQYKAFVHDRGLKSERCFVGTGSGFEDLAKDWRNPGYAQDERHPVTCVSWADATSYVEWLSQKTGKSYRLLTEAEWEYAARAGTTAARFWGEDGNQSCGFANGPDQTAKAQVPGWNFFIANCKDGFAYTAPVGSYRANGFGLYDMLGNVSELTQDCWNENYNGAPADGSAWAEGDCSLPVVRGGSWVDLPSELRSADRNWTAGHWRQNNLGFRVARTN